jgi:hypothetical protein
VWNFGDRQILFSGSGGECNGGLHILSFQARKIGKNLVDGIAISQARKYRAQSDPG